MSIPWLPKEVSSRLYERPHEVENLKTTYLISNAYVAGFLGRGDGKRPAWFNRVDVAPVSTLTADQQACIANACHIVRTKVRHEVTAEPSGLAGKPATTWQSGLLCARVLWRALFAAAGAKAAMNDTALPVLFMSACNGLKQAARKLLTSVWLEVQEQFTSRCNKYRNMKSRPSWSVLEGLQYDAYAGGSHYGVKNPAVTPPSSPGSKPSANLQDFFEEVLALRFAIDWLEASMQDVEDFLEHTARKQYRRPPKIGMDPVSLRLAELKQSCMDSFGTMWTEDAELRRTATLAAETLSVLEGPYALQYAATTVGQILVAMWKGLEPMLSHHASIGVSRIVESQVATATIPPPTLDAPDEDVSQSAVFHLIATSYKEPSSDTVYLTSVLPRGVLGAIVKVQATFRGYVFRSRHFGRARGVAAYTASTRWPRLAPLLDPEEDEEPKDKKKKKAAKVDVSKPNEDVSPRTSRSPAKPAAPSQGDPTPAASTSRTARKRADLSTDRRAWPLPTADHHACADLFALYMYNMYRRRELTSMWRTLCGSYERGMGTFAELLDRNQALRPMLEAISAQLKRGSVVGYDKAFIAKQKKGDETAHPGKLRPADAEIFRRRDANKKVTVSSEAPEARGSPGASSGQTGKATMSGSASAPTLAPPKSAVRSAEGPKGNQSINITEEYLINYLKEMDGDDSQFKDISASIIPLSTGTSPPRVPPPEFILQEDKSGAKTPQQDDVGSSFAASSASAGGTETPTRRPRPKLDVPLCMQKAKPIWLPIKAHRFAAYRAKVLQLLSQKVLAQYISFEKQGQYSACIKLLESATPGSLNVLNPTTLVNNKPLLVETVLQLIVGYSGLCLRNKQGPVAVRLIMAVIDNMSLSLRDLHPGHRTVLEGYLYDTALSVCFYMPQDVSLSDRAESFFLQASDRYLKLGHTNRYCKCCLRAAAVLHGQGLRSEAEYYTQQALNKLSDAPVSSLLAVCYHNLAVHTAVQQRISDAVAHVRAYMALLKQLPKLGNTWLQMMENTQWLILKMQELWPEYQLQSNLREQQVDPRIAWSQQS